jgi:glutamine synthetase
MTFDGSHDDVRRADYRGLAAPSATDFSIMAGSRIEPLLRTIRNSAFAAGIDVGMIKSGRNPGQHGVSFVSQEAMTAADNHAVFRTMAKEIAAQQAMSITFLAAYDEQHENACHVQLSLRAEAGSAASYHNDQRTQLDDSFLAGVLATLADFTLFYAPNVNSYKRLRRGSSAPASIATVAWVENRLAGADVNLYLALAAMIAGGLYGIDHDLELGQALAGSTASTEFAKVPDTLRAAREAFSSSEIVRTAFGDEVVDHYTALADAELAAFESAVTNWEIRRGIERM